MLQCKRELFDMPDDISFFNAAAWSPLPISAIEEGRSGAARKSRPWEMLPGVDDRQFARARQAAAALINAASEDIAIISSVGYGVSTAAKILDLPPGSKILTLDNDHSSPVLEWMTRQNTDQLEIEVVVPGDERDWTSALMEAIHSKGGKPPTLVSISSIHWSDGGQIDLAKIQVELKKHGIMLLVDATHAVGVLPCDVTELDPDFLIFPTYKWLLGPYGRAFLYIAKRHQDAVPLEQTSYARRRVVAEDMQHFTNLQYVDGAQRFDMGERDFFVSLGVACHSMELVQSWGTHNIRERLNMLTRRIEDGLVERQVPVTMLKAELRAPHILSLGFPDGMPHDFEVRLKQQRAYAAPRLGRLRISPHVYNNEADCDRFVTVLADILG